MRDYALEKLRFDCVYVRYESRNLTIGVTRFHHLISQRKSRRVISTMLYVTDYRIQRRK